MMLDVAPPPYPSPTTTGIILGSRCCNELGTISNYHGLENSDFAKRICSDASLEGLPEELLIRVLCCVDHDDLIQLMHVSKTIRKAALMAKSLHFAYSTPTKSAAFRNSVDLDESVYGNENEAPCAPIKIKQISRSRLVKNVAAVSVVLFKDETEDEYLRRRDASKSSI